MKKLVVALTIASLLLATTAAPAMAVCRKSDAISADPGAPSILDPVDLVVNVFTRLSNLIHHTVPKCVETPDPKTDPKTEALNEAVRQRLHEPTPAPAAPVAEEK